MKGLKQAGIVSNLDLQKHMEKFGYHLFRFTVGVWKRDTNNTIFTLVVDAF